MLTRISGVGEVVPGSYPVSDLLSAVDYGLTPELYNAIQLLLKHGVLDANAKLNERVIVKYNSLPALQTELREAVALIKQAKIGGFFSTIWRGVKKVTMAPMRGAYLSLVSLNAFGFASKLHRVIYLPDGVTYDLSWQRKIYDKWNSWGGDWVNLRRAIDNGFKKRAILGAAPAIPAWVAAATAIIAALTPIINSALKAKQSQLPAMDPAFIDPTTGQPYGNPNLGSPSAMDWIRENPAIVAGGLIAIYFLTKKKRSNA